MDKSKFKRLEEYPSVGVTKEGDVFFFNTGRFIPNISDDAERSNKYHRVKVIDLEGKLVSTSVHRLVALAWIHNPTPDAKRYVNHKDGVKGNNHHTNLEWCTIKENNDHAIYTGLWTTTKRCTIRDVRTGQVLEFPSVRQASDYMGLRPDYIRENYQPVRLTKLYGKHYELRIDGDTRPWVHPVGRILRSGRYIVTVRDLEGNPTVFHDVRDLIQTYKLWNMPSMSIAECVKRMARVYPGYEVEVIDQYDTRLIQVLNLETGESSQYETIRQASADTGVDHRRIRQLLVMGRVIGEQGFAFRYETKAPWPDEIEVPLTRSWGITATQSETGESLQFDSLRDIAAHFAVDRSVIKSRLGTDKDYKGWKFSKAS